MKIMYKILSVFAILSLLFIAAPAQGDPEDAVVNRFGYEGCDHTVSTNHFVLKPNQEFSMELDFTQCRPEDLKKLLYFGYSTTKNSSSPITDKDKVVLTIVDPATGEEMPYDFKSPAVAFIQLPEEGAVLEFTATTGKVRKIRLRVSSGL